MPDSRPSPALLVTSGGLLLLGSGYALITSMVAFRKAPELGLDLEDAWDSHAWAAMVLQANIYVLVLLPLAAILLAQADFLGTASRAGRPLILRLHVPAVIACVVLAIVVVGLGLLGVTADRGPWDGASSTKLAGLAGSVVAITIGISTLTQVGAFINRRAAGLETSDSPSEADKVHEDTA